MALFTTTLTYHPKCFGSLGPLLYSALEETKNFYEKNNHQPFIEWVSRLPDKKTYGKIVNKIYRVQNGNFGAYKRLKQGIFELKIYFGPGYRLYCAIIATDKILFLCAGTKATQKKDIIKAQQFYASYKYRENKNAKKLTL